MVRCCPSTAMHFNPFVFNVLSLCSVFHCFYLISVVLTRFLSITFWFAHFDTHSLSLAPVCLHFLLMLLLLFVRSAKFLVNRCCVHVLIRNALTHTFVVRQFKRNSKKNEKQRQQQQRTHKLFVRSSCFNYLCIFCFTPSRSFAQNVLIFEQCIVHRELSVLLVFLLWWLLLFQSPRLSCY